MLIVTTAACFCAGALYGVVLSSSTYGAILAGIGYGLVGLLCGVPIAFAINLTRRLLGQAIGGFAWPVHQQISTAARATKTIANSVFET
jgi:hypothetical protein